MIRFFAIGVLAVQIAFCQKSFYPAAKDGGEYMHNYYLPPAPSSYPWYPDWAPDGKHVAVSLLGSIWNVDVRTGAAAQLMSGRGYHSSPEWSPDGKWLVYTADYDNKRIQLEVLNVATGKTQPLTDDDHLYLDPVFSPDGTRLAYVSTWPNGHFNVYVRPIRNGAWAGPAMAVTKDHEYGRDRLYVGRGDLHGEPAWTPDGQSLVLLSNRGVPLGTGGLWRIPVTEDAMRDGKQVLAEQTLYRARPDVSPDGKRVVYSSTAGAADQFSHLYVLPVDGGAPYKMTFGDHDDFHPRWSPDGEQIAYISNEGGLPRLVILETYGGGKRTVSLKPHWKEPVQTVRVEVVDESGRPVPARVHAVASDGKSYAPLDAYARIGVKGGHFFHTSGTAVLQVPAGKLHLTAMNGFEYWPATSEIDAGTQKQARLVLRPYVDFAARGWHNGSTHVHMNYGGNLRNTLANLMFMSRAEGQDIVNELIANKDNRILDWMYFEPGGREHSISKTDPNMLVMVGEEYRPPFYGHVYYFGLKDHLISPFTTGYEGTGIESLYPSNTDMFRKARAQGAVTGYVHPHSGESDPLEKDLGVGKAFPVDLALGVVDGYEWSNSGRAQMAVWHKALNNDLRVTPTGGEDSISNLHISKPVGTIRTYAHFGNAPLTGANWLSVLRSGATFFSSGPLLEFVVNEKQPGEAINLPASGGRVRVKARVWSIVPISRAVIFHNGQPLKELTIDKSIWSNGRASRPCAEVETDIQVEDSGWYSLYAEGPRSDLLDVDYPQAATNAVRVYVGQRPIRDRPSAEYFIRWIDKLKTAASAWPWWRSQKEIDHVLAQFDEARAVYQKLASEADAATSSGSRPRGSAP